MPAAIGPRPMANARVGQKNLITRRWARRGTRPRGTAGPATEAGLHLRRHLPEARQGRGARHALRRHRGDAGASRRDQRGRRARRPCRARPRQAGWHLSTRPAVPGNITFLPPPPGSPELNPVENVWQSMRQNWLSNRVVEPRRRTASSIPTTTSSPTAARRGTSRSTSPGASSRSASASAQTGSDQWALVSWRSINPRADSNLLRRIAPRG